MIYTCMQQVPEVTKHGNNSSCFRLTKYIFIKSEKQKNILCANKP